jgi:pimeloyl-ACP methyl ester carboxylesterase
MQTIVNRLASSLAAAFLCWAAPARCQDKAADHPYAPIEGRSTRWHQFTRYDFIMEDGTFSLQPFERPENEGAGIGDPAPGRHRCVVVVPAVPAKGNPWSWRGCYWDHQPQTEIELLKRGFHVAYISASATLRPGKQWDAWYGFLTQKHGLSPKPAFIGMSRGGEFAYTWAVSHADKISCIYADNPGANDEVLEHLDLLARHDVPLLHVCGSLDPILPKFTLPIETIYQQLGGRISVMIKEGRGHHPHSLKDPKLIADFVEQCVKENRVGPPAFLPVTSARQYYYSTASRFDYFPSEQTYITCRGPLFTACYERYEMTLPGVEAFSKVIVPQTPAPGNPWVFRADFPSAGDAVDQALLARGFYIVTGAVPFNHDGPLIGQWNLIHQHLVQAGLSRKPVLEGAGAAAGEVLAWAASNPDKAACVYAQNPFLHSNTADPQPLDNLTALARAGVPLLSLCGEHDPYFNDNTRVLEQRYKAAGGSIQVVVEPGSGHDPQRPEAPAPVVDFICRAANLHA